MGIRIRSDAVGYGRNADVIPDRYVRCSRCGFVCDLTRDVRAPYGSRAGWGLRYVRLYTDTTISGAVVADSNDTAIPPGVRITTESGFIITTEDGRELITEG